MNEQRVVRARTFADALHEVATLVERYRHLCEHAAAQPGRTAARRDHMRTISARFPGALRELDSIGLAAVKKRGTIASQCLARLLEQGPAALPTLPTWMIALVELQPRLREVLRIKRFLAERQLLAGSSAARQAVAAWYATNAGGRDPGTARAPEPERMRRIGAPPGGQVQQVAYDEAARALDMTSDELKRCIYDDPTQTQTADP